VALLSRDKREHAASARLAPATVARDKGITAALSQGAASEHGARINRERF